NQAWRPPRKPLWRDRRTSAGKRPPAGGASASAWVAAPGTSPSTNGGTPSSSASPAAVAESRYGSGSDSGPGAAGYQICATTERRSSGSAVNGSARLSSVQVRTAVPIAEGPVGHGRRGPGGTTAAA